MILIPIESDVTNGLTKTGTYKFTINNKDVYLYEKNQEGAISNSYSGNIYIGDQSNSVLPFKIVEAPASVTQDGYIIRRLDGIVPNSFKLEYKTSTIHYLDSKYISNDIARVTDIPEITQSDWAIDDSSNTSYIKNRTHWIENKQNRFGNFIQPTRYNAINGVTYLHFPALTPGASYTVIIDSNSYICTAESIEREGIQYTYLGNFNLIQDNSPTSSFPFVFANPIDGDLMVKVEESIIPEEANGISIKIFETQEIYHVLDEKFIPDTIARISQIPTLDNYYTKSEVEAYHADLEDYTDQQVAALINSAPDTLDTLGELATALQENEEIVDVLNEAIINKADKTDLVGKKVSNGEVFNDYTNNTATGEYSHAEGEETIASGKTSHAEGIKTIAKGYSSHAEGGIYGASNSKPEGWTHTLTASDYPTFLTEDVTIYGSIANGNNSHAEGGGTYAHGEGSHAEGNFTLAMNYGSHSEGYGTQATGYVSHAEGYATKATQQAAHAEGYQTKATGQCAHAEGEDTEASGYYAHAEGHYSKASGDQSHAEGSNTKATASCAHAEGYYTEASYYSHSEGGYTKAIGYYSHSEGQGTEANGQEAHAEGHYSKANGNYSHAEGYQTKTTADGSHAEGHESEASGSYAHAEGFDTQASGFVTHAEGCYTRAIGQYSHAEGEGTVASGESQHVQGKYNIEDTENKYVHIVGNGTSNNGEQENPSNAHTLDWEGNAWFSGDVYVGSTSGVNKDEGSVKLATINDIVQSDWTQNDPESPDYIKNRTHWSKSTFTTLIEEQSVTTVAYDDDDFDYAYTAIPSSLQLIIGQTYEVVFNGVTYECVAYGLPDLGGVIFIGNGSIIGANGGNEEPFCIETYGYDELFLGTVDAGTYTISISSNIEEIHKIDSKYLDLNIISGFSEGSLRTKYSAAGNYGYIMGEYAFAEGSSTQATGHASHAEGMGTEASGNQSHAEGLWTHARNDAAHAEGRSTFAEGLYSHAEGRDATAAGDYSHVEGLGTSALSGVQHVQGKWNIPDSEEKYLHIVGNGPSRYAKSNAHTLDWEGNAWFAGKVFVGGTSMEDATELGSGGSKLVSYNETNVATANQTEFIIDLISFDASVDTVEVYNGRTRLSPSLDYTINGNIITLSEGLPVGRTLDIRILKNVVTPTEEVLIQGSQIAPGSIPLDRLAESIQLDKVFIRHDTTGELYRIGLDDNGLYTVKQSE